MRRKPAEVTQALKQLEIDLMGWRWPKSTTPVLVDAPPIINDIQYNGVPVTHILLPVPVADARAVAEGFDALVARHLSGEANKSTRHFRDNLLRYAFWAGHNPNYDLELDVEKGVCMALGEYTFGIAEGVAIGTVGDHPVDVNMSALTEGFQFKCKEAEFSGLYRHARAQGKKEAMAVLAGLRAYSTTQFLRHFPWATKPRTMPPEDAISEAISKTKNPCGELFALLVPEHMSRYAFENMIMKLEDWKMDPPDSFRASLWDRVVTRCIF